MKMIRLGSGPVDLERRIETSKSCQPEWTTLIQVNGKRVSQTDCQAAWVENLGEMVDQLIRCHGFVVCCL